MPRFMLDKEIVVPPGYAERSCLLVKYRLPLLRHCFVLCYEPRGGATTAEPAELIAFFLGQAEKLALAAVGDRQAYMLIHSGTSIRKRPSWHLHVFVVQHRWQMAWVYTILGAKNFALAAFLASRRLVGRRLGPDPSVEEGIIRGASCRE